MILNASVLFDSRLACMGMASKIRFDSAWVAVMAVEYRMRERIWTESKGHTMSVAASEFLK